MAASLNLEDEDQLQAWQRISQEKGFPGSSAGKESVCNARNSGLISRSGSSPGEGIGYPLLYSWAFLVAQMIKSLPVMSETWVRYLGQEDPLEESMATHPSILAWRLPMDRGTWWATIHGVPNSKPRESQGPEDLDCWPPGVFFFF